MGNTFKPEGKPMLTFVFNDTWHTYKPSPDNDYNKKYYNYSQEELEVYDYKVIVLDKMFKHYKNLENKDKDWDVFKDTALKVIQFNTLKRLEEYVQELFS